MTPERHLLAQTRLSKVAGAVVENSCTYVYIPSGWTTRATTRVHQSHEGRSKFWRLATMRWMLRGGASARQQHGGNVTFQDGQERLQHDCSTEERKWRKSCTVHVLDMQKKQTNKQRMEAVKKMIITQQLHQMLFSPLNQIKHYQHNVKNRKYTETRTSNYPKNSL